MLTKTTSPETLLSLCFPWRHDYIYAPIPLPEERPKWRTESRHELSDRKILKGGQLYGVRFGKETSYFLLDIDKNSPYHPMRDRLAVVRLLHNLEILGITKYVAVSSSHSGGLHLYFPLPEKVMSWKLAKVLQARLTQANFLVKPGILEVFPNDRAWEDEESGRLSLFNAHRLPMQSGSYLLSHDWQPQWGELQEFFRQWAWCEPRNKINQRIFDRLLDQANDDDRTRRKLSKPASKFLLDLHTDINVGWTGRGQTNFLLGRIALRSYVFGHYLKGGKPLNGERLVLDIVAEATQLPGYATYCRHQHEIFNRAEDWARCVENCRRYYPYGRKAESATEDKMQLEDGRSSSSWNEQQLQHARERLELSIAVLLHNDALPSGTTERFDVLTQQFHFSGQTLYKHTDLWHPRPRPVENPPDPPISSEPLEGFASDGHPSKMAQNLLSTSGCNPLPAMDWSALSASMGHQIGRNPLLDKDLSGFLGAEPVENCTPPPDTPPP